MTANGLGCLNHELVLHTVLCTGFFLTLDPFHAEQVQKGVLPRDTQLACGRQAHSIEPLWIVQEALGRRRSSANYWLLSVVDPKFDTNTGAHTSLRNVFTYEHIITSLCVATSYIVFLGIY